MESQYFERSAPMNGKWELANIAAAMAVASALCIPAGAADLGRRHHARAPVVIPPPLYNWTGFYVGVNFGGAFSSEDVTVGNGATFSTDPSGVLGGFQLGYNFMFSPNWLLGIEAEFGWTSAQGAGNFATATTAGSFTSNHNWYDTLAGRLGYTQGPWLYYVKGGGAWMNADYRMVTAGAIVGGSTVNTTPGGFMIGAGAEYMLTPQWSAKVEYDYLDFGGNGLGFGIPVFGATNVNTRVHQFKVGGNYHWISGMPFGRF
jgi:opacity protein-like surface antigen